MKTILLLGGYGFIGTNIIKYIDDNYLEKYSVIVFDRFSKHPQNITFKCVTKSYSGDFFDALCIQKIFSNNHIDLVIHSLSATVPVFSENICFDIDANLKPTLELLSTMINNDVNRIIYISSGGAIYGNNGKMKHCENEDVFPISSYGIVKLAIEKYLFQHYFVYGLRPLVIRLSNPYGPYHYSLKQGIVNVALENALDNTVFQVWGDGSAKKDYIFIKDFCDILFRLIEKNIFNNVFNLGSGNILNINQILYSIKNIIPLFSWEYNSANKFDVNHFELDISRLLSIIGDYYFTPFDDGLLKTLSWIKNEKYN
jgi:UDP-glucose 4-epimerase